MNRWPAFKQLFLTRIREYYREPVAIFWTYGFPLVMALGLGVAFMRREPEPPIVDLVSAGEPPTEIKYLGDRLEAEGIRVNYYDLATCLNRYRTGKSWLYAEVVPDGYRYHFDPARQESLVARDRVDAVIQQLRAGIQLEEPAGSTADQHTQAATRNWSAGEARWKTSDAYVIEPGNRYIDFLFPGLMGMNLLGGGIWGIGFGIVDMRVRKLLKRLMATPMRRSDFLMAMLAARMLLMIPNIVALLLAACLIAHVPERGDFATLALVILLGGTAFSGLGMLVACRATTIETASGLMNLVVMPMWILSGVFFSIKRFPDVMQPIIQALPLTQVNECLREVMLEGATLLDISWRLGILAAWTVVSFVLALKWFRWS